MKIERTRNAKRNMLVGWTQSILSMLFPFVTRTAMIYSLGVEYLGLNSLFTSVISVLNLAELGVGSAMVFSMYKPIAENNEKKICALLNLYKIYYRIIGVVIAIIGIALIPVLPYLIHGDVPSGINVYILYLLNLASTVFTYWLFGYKNCLFSAHQRIDIYNIVSICISFLTLVCQLWSLFIARNYYLYLIVAIITGIINNIVVALIATKMYPNYHANGKLDKTERKLINKRVTDLFTAKIGAIVVNSSDTIVISAFLGLSILAVFQNYYYIMTSVRGFITIIFSSCMAGIGNSLVTESKQKNFYDMKKFTFIIAWLSGFCSVCFLCLYQPFMRIWMGENLILDYNVVICIVIQFYIMEINQLLNLYKDAAGLWHRDRFRPLITAMANLIMNLILVQFWGLYGIMISTVVSALIVGMPWLLHNLFTVLFDRKFLLPFLKDLLYYMLTTIVVCIAMSIVCSFVKLNDITTIVIRFIICCVGSNFLFLCAYSRKNEFVDVLKLIDNITKNKFRLEKNLSGWVRKND